MGSLSPTHWLVIAGLFVLMFGAKRLPDTARSVGRSLRIFRSEVHEIQADAAADAAGELAPAAGQLTAAPAAAPKKAADAA